MLDWFYSISGVSFNRLFYINIHVLMGMHCVIYYHKETRLEKTLYDLIEVRLWGFPIISQSLLFEIQRD